MTFRLESSKDMFLLIKNLNAFAFPVFYIFPNLPDVTVNQHD